MAKAPWNNDLAFMEGWGIFKSDTHGFQIQRCDEADVFNGDDEAQAFVIEQAFSGSEYHKRALLVVVWQDPDHDDNPPPVVDPIKRWVVELRRVLHQTAETVVMAKDEDEARRKAEQNSFNNKIDWDHSEIAEELIESVYQEDEPNVY